MKRKRIFVSSVVQGYTDRRETAREAIEQADSTALLAEDTPPAAGPPRQVVLEELLGRCDALVGIYGLRYGWEGTESGLSPTEEEYDKARELDIPIYAFIDRMQEGEPEPDQKRFLEKVQNWDQGVTRNEFHSLEELKSKVLNALKGRDLSPRYRRFLSQLKRLASEEMTFRESSVTPLPALDLVLHGPGSGMNAGTQSLIAVVDGDLYDPHRVAQAAQAWEEALRARFQLSGLGGRSASAILVVAIEHNPLGWGPGSLGRHKRLAGGCAMTEMLVDLAACEVHDRPRHWALQPWHKPMKALLERAVKS